VEDFAEVRWRHAYPSLNQAGKDLRHRRLLQRVEYIQRSSALHLHGLKMHDMATRAEGFAARTRLGLEQPEVVRRVQSIAKELGGIRDFEAMLARALEGAMSLMGADRGNIQLVGPADAELRIVAHHGFSDEFLEYFAVVSEGSVCTRAARSRAQMVVVDVDEDREFAPHRDIAAASGFRAVQSTPLTDTTGGLVGVLSTHYPHPFAPPGRDLEAVKWYGERIGELIGQRQARTGQRQRPMGQRQDQARSSIEAPVFRQASAPA
jgi:GAF domain-containing protein